MQVTVYHESRCQRHLFSGHQAFRPRHLQAYRFANLDHVTSWRQLARLLIDSECKYIVSILIGGQQKISRWIKGEAARKFSLCGLVIDV